MTDIYINGTLRTDIRPQTGGNISQTADHVTDSNLAVAIPVGNAELKSCDYIKIVDPAAYSEEKTGSEVSFYNVPSGATISKLNQSGATKQIVTVQGKNICPTNFNEWESGAYFNTDGTKVVYPARIRLKKLVAVNPSTTYFCNTNDVIFILRAYDTTGTFARSIGGIVNGSTFTTASNEYYIGVSLNDKTDYAEFQTAFANGTIKPFICLNSETDKSYAPFVPNSPSIDYPAPIIGVTKTIVNGMDYPLPQTGYNLPNGVCDVWNAITGAFTRNVKYLVLNGTENWEVSAISMTDYIGFYLSNADGKANGSGLCNKFVAGTRTNWDAPLLSEFIIPKDNTNTAIRILKSRLTGWSDSWTSEQKIAAFKTWLSANPVTIIYQLATPVQITGTPISIPVNGTANISSDGGTVTAQIKYHDDETIFAGTILGIKQQNHGYSPDLTDKYFDLTIASNAQLTSKVYVDMQFPAGATVTQVLKGNHSGDAWYNSALGEFYGIVPIRINAEGITTGAIDDFSNITLSEVAFLWGQTVNDVLDAICKTAGAWWEVTSDKVFNMRFNASHGSAPFVLDENAPAYDLEPTSDAYTMYSAVRVVGGKGEGGLKWSNQFITGQHNFLYGDVEQVDSKTLKLKYPVHSFADQTNNAAIFESSALGYVGFNVGFKGIDDNNATYQALASYGSDTITLKDGYSFQTLPGTKDETKFINIQYYPLVPIVTRLVDPNLSAEIKVQRGGTGVIEYILKDDTITNFSIASETGMNFLKENAKRTDGIKFKTKATGFAVGQLLQGNVPYYGVLGEYLITSVEAIAVTGTEGVIWEYGIEASTSAYRDSLKGLFYTSQKISLKLGDDFPANDGLYINSEISIQSELEMRAINPPTWTEIDVYSLTWAEFEAQGKTWKELENTLCECDLSGNYLTAAAKSIIAGLLNGNGISQRTIDTDGLHILLSNGAGYDMRFPNWKIESANSLTRSYYISESELKQSISKLIFGFLGMGIGVQTVPTHIDKTESNPYGNFALVITKKDTVTGTYITDAIKSIILELLVGNQLAAGTLKLKWLELHRSNGAAIEAFEPVETTLKNDSVINTYYVNETVQDEIVSGIVLNDVLDDRIQIIPLSINKTTSGPLGKYALTIVKKDTVI